jgi:hypothetical protein
MTMEGKVTDFSRNTSPDLSGIFVVTITNIMSNLVLKVMHDDFYIGLL